MVNGEAGKGSAIRPFDPKKWDESPYWKQLEQKKKKERKRGKGK